MAVGPSWQVEEAEPQVACSAGRTWTVNVGCAGIVVMGQLPVVEPPAAGSTPPHASVAASARMAIGCFRTSPSRPG
jgi:hypothetical protein